MKRSAMLLTDRSLLMLSLKGSAQHQTSIVVKTSGTITNTLPIRHMDPEHAKELLTEAGYPDGITVNLKNISREPDNTLVQLIQAQMAEAGVTVEIDSMERNSMD